MAQIWYRLVVGDPMVDADPFAAIAKTFGERFPTGAARLLTRLESAGGVHCVAVAYLSPEAGALGVELGATPVVGPPDRDC